MNDMKCPYCGADQEVNHDDGQGYDQDVAHQQECSNCGKTYIFKTVISFDYYPEQADCLNGEPHRYKPTMTWPKSATKMRCEICEEERNPTKKEFEEILSNIKTL